MEILVLLRGRVQYLPNRLNLTHCVDILQLPQIHEIEAFLLSMHNSQEISSLRLMEENRRLVHMVLNSRDSLEIGVVENLTD